MAVVVTLCVCPKVLSGECKLEFWKATENSIWSTCLKKKKKILFSLEKEAGRRRHLLTLWPKTCAKKRGENGPAHLLPAHTYIQKPPSLSLLLLPRPCLFCKCILTFPHPHQFTSSGYSACVCVCENYHIALYKIILFKWLLIRIHHSSSVTAFFFLNPQSGPSSTRQSAIPVRSWDSSWRCPGQWFKKCSIFLLEWNYRFGSNTFAQVEVSD